MRCVLLLTLLSHQGNGLECYACPSVAPASDGTDDVSSERQTSLLILTGAGYPAIDCQAGE